MYLRNVVGNNIIDVTIYINYTNLLSMRINMEEAVADAVLATMYMNTAMLFLLMTQMKKKRKHRFWIRKIFQDREEAGYNNRLLQELRSHDREYYFDFMRMEPEVFDMLLSQVKPHIEKETTFWRRPISATERLAITLRFLASGETFRSLSMQFRVGRMTICKIVPETCEAIWNCFAHDYMKFPTSPDDWKKIAKGFEDKWQMPHCCGSIDGKHVSRECPPNTGSLHFNYKGTFSSVLMALADAHYRFVMIDFGHYGSESDGGIFRKSAFGSQVLNGTLNLPKTQRLPNSDKHMPYFFVGDEAFPLCYNLLRPYPKSDLSYDRKIFNYRLSRARRVVENAFGIMAARFRIFKRPLNYSDKSVEKMILASCILHNILIEMSPAYCPTDFVDSENHDADYIMNPGKWRGYDQQCLTKIGHLGSNTYTRLAKQSRESYVNYVVNEGAVQWQDERIKYSRAAE